MRPTRNRQFLNILMILTLGSGSYAYAASDQQPDAIVIPGAKVSTTYDARQISVIEYLKEIQGGVIQAPPLPVKIGETIEGFATPEDRLWEVRFIIPEKGLHALILINAENGKVRIVCRADKETGSLCPITKQVTEQD